MKTRRAFSAFFSGFAIGSLLIVVRAAADYDTHPELRPENRCVTDDGTSLDGTIHCQRLFWDLQPTTALGEIRVAAPFEQDPVPRFPNGAVDRPPPLFVADEDADGLLEGFESEGAGRLPLCGSGEIPWWEPLIDETGNPAIGSPGDVTPWGTVGGRTASGELWRAVDDPGTPGIDESESGNQRGPLFRVACRRGSRVYFGPWQTGRDTAAFDRVAERQMVRIESTAHLDLDESGGRLADRNGDGVADRVLWHRGTTVYNHFGSHHVACWLPNPADEFAECSDPSNPQPREAYDSPDGACRAFQAPADEGGSCYSADADVDTGQPSTGPGSGAAGCPNGPAGGAFHSATQVPGRFYAGYPENRGLPFVEDQILTCNHHVVTQLPPGSYSMDRLADFRLQAGGLLNPRTRGLDCEAATDDPQTTVDETRDCRIYGIDAGQVIGGAVGEMVTQYFHDSWLNAQGEASAKPINLAFIAVTDAATTYYPPFTWNHHTTLWTPPFDAAVGLYTIHSHHRMVKGTMDVVPSNPVRLESPDALCGGAAGGSVPTHPYTNWQWEDAHICDYWREPDGPIIVRKGEALATTCYVNNGVTPEAIKHGLVAGHAVEALRAMAPDAIPDYPEIAPAEAWGDLLVRSPVGRELLYGTHPPINYRVVYKCAPDGPGSSLVNNAGLVRATEICAPNPMIDADGDYVDGPYLNEEICGEGQYCEPSSIRFACVGEEEMCIGVAFYWALDRVGDFDGGHEDAMDAAFEGDVDRVGTPGTTGFQADFTQGGFCPECGEPGF